MLSRHQGGPARGHGVACKDYLWEEVINYADEWERYSLCVGR
jgi:hypothetical protein